MTSKWPEASRLPERGAGELADEEGLEQLETEAPGEGLRRREFLTKTAAAAGAAGLATALPSDRLVAEAAHRQLSRRLPSPRALPIDTFVVVMMENRSFDHYFGWRKDADARNAGLSYPDRNGRRIPTYRLTPDFQGCGHPDPNHNWAGGRWQMNGGRNDRFVTGDESLEGSDEFAIGYYLEDDLPFLGPASRAFQLHDRFFCSIMASTYPNRHYMWAAQGGGVKNNELPFDTLGQPWETIFDRALRNGVSAQYFASDLPFAALYGTRGVSWTRRVEEYYERARMGTLPNITFVDPPFRDGGGGDGVSADDHPHGDIRLGQAFLSDVVHAFMESPQWKRGALFVVYDEWGGFFDHVKPPRVPDERASKDPNEDWGQMGFRIPALSISPYAYRGRVSHATLGFESILKLISYKFGLGYLTRRHKYALNIGRTFNWGKPSFAVPRLPDPGVVATAPCRTGGGKFPDPTGGAVPYQPGGDPVPRTAPDAGPTRPHPHDIVELETSGYLDRFGYKIPKATYDSIYRDPDSFKRALAQGDRARR